MTQRPDTFERRPRIPRRCAVAMLLVIVPLRVTRGEPPEGAFPKYVGNAVCRRCHEPPGERPRCSLPPIPEHDRSYAALQMIPAESIAALSGVAERATTSRICLDCHATAADEGRRWTQDTFRIEDGVQCETCHGAGSAHVAAARAPTDDPAPAARGLISRGDRRGCERCHIDRPSHREVLENGFTLSAADRAYKTPVNLTCSPDGRRLYVVCEHRDSVVVIDTHARALLGEVTVGRRPFAVAVSPDGERLFVSNRIGGTLSVIDTSSRAVVTEVAVGAEPHGVLIAPGDDRVFVACTGQDLIAVVDAKSLNVLRHLPAGRGPWSIAGSRDGRRGFVTNVRPNPGEFRDPPRSELTVLDLEKGRVSDRLGVDEANMMQGVATLPGADVAVFTLLRTKNLIPTTRVAQGWVVTNALGIAQSDGRIDQVLLDAPNDFFSDPMDVAVSPDGRRAIVTSGGGNEVAVVDLDTLRSIVASATAQERAEVLPNHLGMSRRFIVKRLPVGTNPRGVVYSPDGAFAYVANALDDTVSVIDTVQSRVVDTIVLGGPKEITQVRMGERLFHSAAISFGGQFSCRSCHPDGHHNGLTFDIEADGIGVRPVDNRTLRGIFDTPPFKWEGTNPTLHRQCGPRFAAFFTRLAPFSPAELDALVRYIATIERPPNPYRRPEGLTLEQRRGKAVFERTTSNQGTPLAPGQRCVTCHNGAYRTDRRRSTVASTMWFDVPLAVDLRNLFNAQEHGELGAYFMIEAGGRARPFDTPHLRNLYNDGPYLHNGAANTLEEIWTRFNLQDRHGATTDLTREQLNDLIAYLKAQ